MQSTGSEILEAQPDIAAGVDLFDHWLALQLAEKRVPGVSIGIVYDQTLLWAKGYGSADLASQTPTTTTTLYRVASNTKMFTATAIMQLRDAGELALDDPVSKYLPWFSIRYREDQTGDQPPITIRQLLTHTSGLPRDATVPIWSVNSFPPYEQLVATTPQRDAALLTDEKWTYSNLGYAIAGEVIEVVSGEDYASYVQRHILEPLEMPSTRVKADADLPGLATGYLRPDVAGQHEVVEYADIQGLLAAAGIVSNVEDLARFVMLQFRDEAPSANPVLRGGSLREMHPVQWMKTDWQSGWGLGLGLHRVGETVVAGHGGALKGYLSQTAWSREDQFGVIALTNGLNALPGDYVEQAFKLVAPRVKQALGQTPPQADEFWRRLMGQYHSAWGFDFYLLPEGGQLQLVSLNATNEAHAILEPVAADTFRVIQGGNLGELCRFERDDSGEVLRMYLAADSFERV